MGHWGFQSNFNFALKSPINITDIDGDFWAQQTGYPAGSLSAVAWGISIILFAATVIVDVVTATTAQGKIILLDFVLLQ